MNSNMAYQILSLVSLLIFVPFGLIKAQSSEKLIRELQSGGTSIKHSEFKVEIPGFHKAFSRVNFIEKRESGIFKTTDGGLSWIRLDEHVNISRFLEKRNDGKLMLTKDKGKTWDILNSIEINSMELMVFPNPAHESIELKLRTGSGIFKLIQVLDLTGEIKKTIKTGNAVNFKINILNLNPGIYFLRCEDNSGNFHFAKFVKN